jgi:hypothetical protein
MCSLVPTPARPHISPSSCGDDPYLSWTIAFMVLIAFELADASRGVSIGSCPAAADEA